MANVTDIIEYYVNLLIIQYNNQPKARATIDLFAKIMLADGILLDIQEAYDVQTAVGVQLDVIGKYVGIDRLYQPQDFTGYFSTIIYSQVASPPTQLGFTNYASYPLPAGKVLLYSNMIGGNSRLSDDNFRTLINLAIITNNSNFSRKSIDDNIFSIFGESVQASSAGNMVMYYFVPVALSPVMLAALQKALLPKPMGVRLGGLIQQVLPFFGFATYAGESPLITGFANYSDYARGNGETLAYADIIH